MSRVPDVIAVRLTFHIGRWRLGSFDLPAVRVKASAPRLTDGRADLSIALSLTWTARVFVAALRPFAWAGLITVEAQP